jgi:hypothetical protein
MSGEKDLLVAVFKLAVHDGDEEFFNSQTFEAYCCMLGIKDDIGIEAVRNRCLKEIRGNKK